MKKLLRNNQFILLFLAAALVMVVTSVYSEVLMANSSEMLAYNTHMRLLALAKSAAQLVTGEELDRFSSPEDMQTPEYAALKERLYAFTVDSEIEFTYYMRPAGDDTLQFIIDSDYDPETQVGLADEPVDYEPAPVLALNGTAATAGLGNYSINWDGILAAYAPVYDASGQVTAIAGVDMSDVHIVTARQNILLLTICHLVALALVLVTGILSILLYRRKAALSESASRAKSEFLSRMSHEIRTPINAIVGFSRMARDSREPEQTNQYLKSIGDASSHLMHLVNNILDINEIESGKIVLRAKETDLRALIGSIEQMLVPELRDKELSFTVTIDERLPTCVLVDAERLQQVLLNLLGNAIKFTPEGGHIELKAQVADITPESVLTKWIVLDDGIGIDEKFLPRLFEPFEQADGSNTRRYGGAGLGLALCKQFVELMDGSILANNRSSGGTEFALTFRMRIVAQAPTADAPRDEAPLDLSGKFLLLVEDMEVNQLIAEDALTSFGAQVDIAQNGLEAVTLFEQSPDKYAMIFMDIQMPVMDGYEATRSIRASAAPRAKTIPIIAMSANVFSEDIERAIAAGMNAYVAKPFDIDQVEKEIRAAL